MDNMRWNKRKKQKHVLRVPKNKIILLLIVLLIPSVMFFIWRANIFAIKTIDVQTNNLGCVSKEQIRDDSHLFGQIIFFIDSIKLENDLKKKFFCVKNVDVAKKIPDYIKLNVFGRDPAIILSLQDVSESSISGVLDNFSYIASSSAEASSSAQFSFSVDSQSEKFLVDKNGVVYSKNVENINVPQVFVTGVNISLGQTIKEGLIENTLKIIEKIKTYGVEIKDAKIYSEKALLINGMPKTIFRLDDRVDKQIASLQLILKTAKIDSNTVEFVDLRFDKPVVKFAPKKK